MTLLAVYETPSERKQRRNKLEVGRPGWCPRCALISQPRQHFFCFYGHLYGPVFGLLIRGRKERASKIQGKGPPRQLHEQIPPHLEIKITPVFLPVQAAVPQTPRPGVDKEFLSIAVSQQSQAPLAALTRQQPHENRAGVRVLPRPVSSPHQDTLNLLSQNPPKCLRAPSPSIT